MAYRRPAFCVFDRAFWLVTASDTNHQSPQIVSLPRDVAQEFVLAAALAPVLSADTIAAPYLSQIFATDAPEAKGAFCAADAPTDVCSYLWQASDRKGASLGLPLDLRLCSKGLTLLGRSSLNAGLCLGLRNLWLLSLTFSSYSHSRLRAPPRWRLWAGMSALGLLRCASRQVSILMYCPTRVIPT